MNLTAWAPKSVLALRDDNWRKFAANIAAGVTVGLVALPLSMVFAIACGAPPEAGLYSAAVAGFALFAHVSAARERANAIHDGVPAI